MVMDQMFSECGRGLASRLQRMRKGLGWMVRKLSVDLWTSKWNPRRKWKE